jgi:hypothetical protein
MILLPIVSSIFFILMIVGFFSSEKSLFWYNGERTKLKSFLIYFFGWVTIITIISQFSDKKPNTEDLDKSDYELLTDYGNNAVHNYHIYVKNKNFDKQYLLELAMRFKAEHCKMACNISMYDSKDIKDLIRVYPLKKNDYLKFADHFIGELPSGDENYLWWYPYQDFKYRDYGGKNWKKKPID